MNSQRKLNINIDTMSSAPATDSRGVSRGRCTMALCFCSEYQGGTAGLKCFGCAHPPGKHLNLSKDIKNVSYSHCKKIASIVWHLQ